MTMLPELPRRLFVFIGYSTLTCHIEVRLLLGDNIEMNLKGTQYQDVKWIQLVQEHGNKSSGPIKDEEFLHQLKDDK
jgi:hypothetical protein